MNSRESSPAHAETRKRLLEAAGELFAEKGFRLAGTREICRRAGSDIAAIHYHFGSKQALYEQVLRYADSLLVDPVPPLATERSRSREVRLGEIIEWVLSQCFAQGQPEWRWKFVEQSATEVTPSLQAFIDSKVLPVYKALDSICREFLGQNAPQQEVRFATRSILGQCFYYRHFRVLISGSGENFSPDEILHLRDHIATFSVGGLKERARQMRRAQRNGSDSDSRPSVKRKTQARAVGS